MPSKHGFRPRAGQAGFLTSGLEPEVSRIFLIAGEDMVAPPFGEKVRDSHAKIAAVRLALQYFDAVSVRIMFRFVRQVAWVPPNTEQKFLALQVLPGVSANLLQSFCQKCDGSVPVSAAPQFDQQLNYMTMLAVKLRNADAAFRAPLEWTGQFRNLPVSSIGCLSPFP